MLKCGYLAKEITKIRPPKNLAPNSKSCLSKFRFWPPNFLVILHFTGSGTGSGTGARACSVRSCF